MDDNNRNLILAMVLSALVMVGWYAFFAPPEPTVDPAAVPTATTAPGTATAPAPGNAVPAPGAVQADTGAADPSRDAARLAIQSPALRGTISLAAERHRNLSTPLEDPASARDPEELERQAAAFGEELERLRAELETDRARLAELGTQRGEAEASLKAAEDRHVAAVRAIADRREGLAKLTGQVNTLRARASSSEEEIARLSTALTDAVGGVELSPGLGHVSTDQRIEPVVENPQAMVGSRSA